MNEESEDGILPFPFNYIIVIGAFVGLALLLDAGLSTHPISSFFQWINHLWDGMLSFFPF